MTSTGTESRPDALVRALITLDYDAIAVYQAAANRVRNPDMRTQLEAFCHEHERHAREMGRCLHRLGESAPKRADMRALFIKASVIVDRLRSDRDVLDAVRIITEDVCAAYRRAAERDDLDDGLRFLIRRILQDERRHGTWIRAWLDNVSGG